MKKTMTPALDRPEDENISFLHLHNHHGPSGVPLGGIGVGYMELDPSGTFTRNGFGNIHHSYADTPDGCFLALWEEGAGAVRLQRDEHIILGMPGYTDADARALLPSIRLDFAGQNTMSVRASYTAFSGMTAQNIRDSALPVIYYEVELENPGAEEKIVSAALSWGDLLGRGLRDTVRYDRPDFNEDGTSASWDFMTPPDTAAQKVTIGAYTGIRQFVRNPRLLLPHKWTFQNYNTDCLVLAEQQEGAEISLLPAYAVDTPAAWDSFREQGRFAPAAVSDAADVCLSSGGDPEQVVSASAAAVRLSLLPGEKKVVRFMTVWFMPEPDEAAVQNGPARSFLPGTNYSKYYHNFFGDVQSLAAYAIGEREAIHAGFEAWQRPILESNLPAWLQFKQINSGFTLYTNTVLNKKGVFACLEGEMGGLGGTMDQKMSSHPVYQKLYTELDNHENESFANTQGEAGDILHYNVHYYNGVADYDPRNKVTPTPHGSMVDNSASWVIQLLKTYQQTGDRALLADHFSHVCRAVAFVDGKCPPDRAIPAYGTTYDDASHPPLFIFAASMYAAMLCAAEKIARILGKKDTADTWHRRMETVLADTEDLYVTEPDGGYYAFGCEPDGSGRREEVMFIGQLAGPFVCRYSGWGDLLSHAHSTAAMKKLLQTSVQHTEDYYAPKIYDWVTGQSLDSAGSRCWPFYLDSYTGMEAIYLGYVEDGLDVLAHTQLVHFRRGFTWTQNLWNPAYATYMTAPVVWFINDVLAGAAMDVQEHVLTLGPTVIPGTKKLVTPLYYPTFWANLLYDEEEKKASLTILRTFGGEEAIHFDTLRVVPNGCPASAEQLFTLPVPFAVREGAVLDLSPYMDAFMRRVERDKVLQPVRAYDDSREPERVADGCGLRGMYTLPDGCRCRVDPLLDFAGGAADAKDPDGWFAAAGAVRWNGSILPRYAQQYRLTFRTAGAIRVTLGKRVLLDDPAGDTVRDHAAACMLEAGRLYPIEIEYTKAGEGDCLHFRWWSTTQTEEIVIRQRLYPPFNAFEPLRPSDFTSKQGEVRVENRSQLGFIRDGDSVFFRELDFGDGSGDASFCAEVSAPWPGASIEIYRGTLESGEKIAVLPLPRTDSFGDYREVCGKVGALPGGLHPLTLRFCTDSGNFVCNIRSFRFI